jgi:hypothetical protein
MKGDSFCRKWVRDHGRRGEDGSVRAVSTDGLDRDGARWLYSASVRASFVHQGAPIEQQARRRPPDGLGWLRSANWALALVRRAVPRADEKDGRQHLSETAGFRRCASDARGPAPAGAIEKADFIAISPNSLFCRSAGYTCKQTDPLPRVAGCSGPNVGGTKVPSVPAYYPALGSRFGSLLILL